MITTYGRLVWRCQQVLFDYRGFFHSDSHRLMKDILALCSHRARDRGIAFECPHIRLHKIRRSWSNYSRSEYWLQKVVGEVLSHLRRRVGRSKDSVFVRDTELIRKYTSDYPQPRSALHWLCRQPIIVSSTRILKTKILMPLQRLDSVLSIVEKNWGNSHSHLWKADCAL